MGGDSIGVVRITVTVDEELLATAAKLTGVLDHDALGRLALQKLIQVESARRLAALGGTDKSAASAPRAELDRSPG